MTEELYLYKNVDGVISGYTLMDIENVDIVRVYTSPYFSDIERLKNEGTFTIKLPTTAVNKAFFEYLHRPDILSQIPYDYIYADYFYNGRQIFKGAEVKFLSFSDNYEIQCVWGVNRLKYLPLFEKKLNEIGFNGTTITESDWVVRWDKIGIHETGKKYKYINYIKRQRTSDIITLNGVIQPKVELDEPMLSNQDEMTHHPFVSFVNMLDLINEDNAYQEEAILKTSINPSQTQITFTTKVAGIISVGDTLNYLGVNAITPAAIVTEIVDEYTVEFDEEIYEFYEDGIQAKFTAKRYKFDFSLLKERLKNKGLILGGRKDNYVYSHIFVYPQYTAQSEYLYINDAVHDGILAISNYFVTNQIGRGGDFKTTINFKLDFRISGVTGLSLCRSYYDIETETTIEEVLEIIRSAGTDLAFFKIYKTTVSYELSNADDKTYQYYIRLNSGVGGGVVAEFDEGSNITVSYSIDTSVFRYVDISDESVGRYNCLLNLPNITQMEFIQQMLIQSGVFYGYNEQGDVRDWTLDEFVDNLNNGNVYDWSGKVSHTNKIEFKFNSNAQKNYLRFRNWEDVDYDNAGQILVNDRTIELEKDLQDIKFDIANKSGGWLSEFILYEQEVTSNGETDPLKLQKTFSNNYSEKPSVCVFDLNGYAINEQVLPISTTNNDTLTILLVRGGTNELDISEYYEPDIIVPEIGNKVVSVDGVAVENVYVTGRDFTTITLNENILNDDDEHFVEFDKSTKGFIELYYPAYQKLVEQPDVRECEVNLGVFESSEIDYAKPIYVDVLGHFCLLLELQAPNKELCVAKLMLIKKEL